jgi:hypothetical protein
MLANSVLCCLQIVGLLTEKSYRSSAGFSDPSNRATMRPLTGLSGKQGA